MRPVHDLGRLAAPSAPDGLAFEQPWEAQAFALTLALSERGVFTLEEFQQSLISRIGAYEATACIVGGEDYYTRWIEALQDLLAERGVLPAARMPVVEADIVFDAASRKAHQHLSARDADGRLKIAPLVIDRPSAT
ncbi:nitrile hydratase accessory protein [Hansschlegelia quercus]|uniref:Nitrile hydratase accessory protein n=1 Tax=Hansschlegelia quercus TaxID=2528245 RepID=A0A4V2JE26_9HYPH|nr:nitrile hydratase accessory protein [Hansschlegelia quercus]TBN53606.1 nitrile hydratase accessory protein [Hansschlegelia quercus]